MKFRMRQGFTSYYFWHKFECQTAGSVWHCNLKWQREVSCELWMWYSPGPAHPDTSNWKCHIAQGAKWRWCVLGGSVGTMFHSRLSPRHLGIWSISSLNLNIDLLISPFGHRLFAVHWTAPVIWTRESCLKLSSASSKTGKNTWF